MTSGEVLVQLDDDVLRVTINRPEKRNPLSGSVLAAIGEAFRVHRDRPELRLGVVTAAGNKSFAAGGDLREVESIREIEAARQFSNDSYAALDEIRRFPLPVIAALNGDALGGGAELAVACDIRLMAAHARIGFIQGRINISTSWGGGVDLMRLVGHARALSLLSRSAVIGGAEAVSIGLADAVGDTDQEFTAFVDGFAAPLRRQAPRVLRGFKAVALAQRLGLPHQQCRAVELEHFVTSWVHDDHWVAAAKVLAPGR